MSCRMEESLAFRCYYYENLTIVVDDSMKRTIDELKNYTMKIKNESKTEIITSNSNILP